MPPWRDLRCVLAHQEATTRDLFYEWYRGPGALESTTEDGDGVAVFIEGSAMGGLVDSSRKAADDHNA
jgi:hypothetical protein